jgi:predicted membrane GTPase involved in stress response
MKNKFGFDSFKNMGTYMSFRGENCEICLEPCLNGCDVAVYDLRQNLLEPKYCTNIDLSSLSEFGKLIKVRRLAITKAIEFYEKYESCKSSK